MVTANTSEYGICTLLTHPQDANWLSWHKPGGGRVSVYFASVEDAMKWYRIVK